MALWRAIALALVSFASAVTPVEKVITLLDGLKTDIETQGKNEATQYDKQACFCKETTASKSKSITTGQDTIDKLSAAIADNTATKLADETKLQGLKDKKEALAADLTENTGRCAKEKAEYEGLAADFNKAIKSLKSALKGMADKKKAIGEVKSAAAFLEVNSGVKETLELADAMGLITAPRKKTVSALLQQGSSVDPVDPDYKYHSADIVALLESLKKDFSAEKVSLDTEFGKTEQACKDIMSGLSGKIETNTQETGSVGGKINKGGSTIADDRGKLVEAQSSMQDDEQYLKELTTTCEKDANRFDQRATMRAGEIESISSALTVLKDKVKPADTKVNKRSFAQHSVVSPEKMAEEINKVEEEPKKVMSFLQRRAVNNLANALLNQEAQEQIMKEKIAITIRDAGVSLASPMLTALSMRIAADPFKKVKKLIQGLVERLITESAREASKKGFCDTQLGLARRNREREWTSVEKITAQIATLQSKADQLTEEIAAVTKALEALDKAVKESTQLRTEQKADNEQTLVSARDGFKAVNEALLLLRSFYKEAAKAKDEESGTYTGQQDSSTAILGLLETISSDFDRTIRTTESDEDSAAKAYVEFQRSSKVDIAGKTTQKELDTQDLQTTNNMMKKKGEDHANTMDLVDDYVKALWELKPACVDSGMSYKDRVSKREEEVKALNKALCILDTEKVEEDCKAKISLN